MRVLVTGHRGFVGTHLRRALAGSGAEVLGIDLKEDQDILSANLPEVDRVYHLAAQTDAQAMDAGADASVNIMGSLRIFERYRGKVVFASSSMVNYPITPYAISKRAGEDYARFYGCAVVRFCNLYGEGGHSVADKFREASVLNVYGTGQQLRTYAPVSAAVAAMLSVKPGELHVLQGQDLTVNDVAAMFPRKPVNRLPAKPLDLIHAPQRAA